MSEAELSGRRVLILEPDAARAGQLVLALRALGAQGVRAELTLPGAASAAPMPANPARPDLDRARALRPELVLVEPSPDPAVEAVLASFARDPILKSAAIVRASVWSAQGEPDPAAIVRAVTQTTPGHARVTRQERPVSASVFAAAKSVGLVVGRSSTASLRSRVDHRSTERMPRVDAPVPARGIRWWALALAVVLVLLVAVAIRMR